MTAWLSYPFPRLAADAGTAEGARKAAEARRAHRGVTAGSGNQRGEHLAMHDYHDDQSRNSKSPAAKQAHKVASQAHWAAHQSPGAGGTRVHPGLSQKAWEATAAT